MTNDIRCGHCRRKLAEGRFIELTIKCPRCGQMNHLITPERQRAPCLGDHDGHQSDHPLAGRQTSSG
ncbi:Com family DNA-binding transcriptional regulator [Crenobacter luteus]|uniref:Com family DNA-binding transcriptional regulator n=1 Tax=Crenobacter luteus TaxID=1452487 RepID=UPI0009EEAD6B|nr:Com family DNA-binding transcriptional regulator [Crenobacter luteus]